MLEFNKEIINGSFNKVSKRNKEIDSINVSVKTKDKNIEVNVSGQGLLIAGAVAIAPTAICVLGATIAVCAITKQICQRRKSRKEL
ncbi:hypothetical protein [Clostridium sp.]|jgi:hypothetical protein|uniref:hypothetical protein n=1 Tax=Clostridium sp. TaxID=1506 RepID=UPI00284D9BE7|nr:hypothetical protein [Clostridium sp.]MDR3597182.1 hypothetical protein [Clostridium sp.]